MLLEIEPEKQKTRVDFAMTEKLLGVPTVGLSEVVVRGRVDGKLYGSERIQIWHTAKINGDMKSERISIEEGSELHGQMEAGKLSSSAAEAFVTGTKSESKVKEAGSGEGKASSGAAVAGAD